MGPNSKLALIGGLMINCVGKKTDMFLPLRFEVRTKNGNTKNVFKEVFGKSENKHCCCENF